MSVSKGEYDPLEDPIYVHGPVALLVGSVLLERAVTLIYWDLESNPVVSTLGMYHWLFLTFVLVALIPVAWYAAFGFENRIVRILVYGLTAFHLLAVVTNLAVVVFF